VNTSIFKVKLANNLNLYKKPVAHKTAILDSGCSSHNLKRGAYCINKWIAHIPIRVILPDGTTLSSSATAESVCPTFNLRARSAHIINDLASHSLLARVFLLTNEKKKENNEMHVILIVSKTRQEMMGCVIIRNAIILKVCHS
jgi:hypothetical protein